jgi:hypothetical protein
VSDGAAPIARVRSWLRFGEAFIASPAHYGARSLACATEAPEVSPAIVGMPYVLNEEDPVVELLLCASDLARRGVAFPLSAAVEALGHTPLVTRYAVFAPAAFTAAMEAREVGALYGEAMNADAFLEAAYRLMGGTSAAG